MLPHSSPGVCKIKMTVTNSINLPQPSESLNPIQPSACCPPESACVIPQLHKTGEDGKLLDSTNVLGRLPSSAHGGRTSDECYLCHQLQQSWEHRQGPRQLSLWSTEIIQFSSVQFSRSVVPDSLRPYGPQHAKPPCPSPTPGVHPNPCPYRDHGKQ